MILKFGKLEANTTYDNGRYKVHTKTPEGEYIYDTSSKTKAFARIIELMRVEWERGNE